MIGFVTKTDLEMGNYQGHVPANLRKQNDTRKVQNLSLFTVKTVVSRALISLYYQFWNMQMPLATLEAAHSPTFPNA